MSETWKRIKEEIGGVYRRARNAVATTVDTVKLKNRIAAQREIVEDAQLAIGKIICEARRGMTDPMPTQLLLKENEATRLDELLCAINASEKEIEALETELSILKQSDESAEEDAEPIAQTETESSQGEEEA